MNQSRYGNSSGYHMGYWGLSSAGISSSLSWVGSFYSNTKSKLQILVNELVGDNEKKIK